MRSCAASLFWDRLTRRSLWMPKASQSGRFDHLKACASVLVIPWRICFDIEPDALATVVDVLVDLIFLMDMATCFRTAFVDSDGTIDTARELTEVALKACCLRSPGISPGGISGRRSLESP